MTIVSLILVAFLFGFLVLFDLVKKKKYKILATCSVGIVLIMTMGLILIPKTSFYKNIQIHLDFLGVESVSEIMTNKEILDHFVFSQRLTFLKTTNDNYQKASVSEKLLGIGYIENYGTDEVNVKLIEMDGFDIFYRHGILGFLIYFLPVLYITVLTIRQTSKKKFEKEDLAFYTSIGLCFFMSLLVGHVFVAPAVSIFVAIILVNQYHRTKPAKQ